MVFKIWLKIRKFQFSGNCIFVTFFVKKSLQRFCYLARELSILGENVSSDGQNYCSKGSKWGIVHLCSSNSIWDMTEVMDIITFWKMYFLTFFHQKCIGDWPSKNQNFESLSTKIMLSCNILIKNMFINQFKPLYISFQSKNGIKPIF